MGELKFSALPLTSLFLPSSAAFPPLHTSLWGELLLWSRPDLSEISPPSKAETPHEVSPYTSLFHRWEKASAVWFSVSQRGYFSPLVHNTHWFVSWCCAVPQAVWGISPCLVTPQPGRSHPRTTAAREDGNTSLVGAVLVCFIKHDPTALWKRMFYTDSMYIYFAGAGGKETQTNWFWKKLQQLCIWWEIGCLLNQLSRNYFLLNISRCNLWWISAISHGHNLHLTQGVLALLFGFMIPAWGVVVHKLRLCQALHFDLYLYWTGVQCDL